MTDKVDRSIVNVLTKALDDLCAACMDEQGNPKAPDRRALMKARAILPAGYSTSLIKEKA